MSISSVPGTNSVFFASLPIDYLPIDRVWERYTGLTHLSSRAGVIPPGYLATGERLQHSPPQGSCACWSQSLPRSSAGACLERTRTHAIGNLPWGDRTGVPSLFLENHARRPIHKLNVSKSSHIIVV